MIHLKNKMFLMSLFYLACISFVQAQDYFPHAIGNNYSYEGVVVQTLSGTVVMQGFYCCDNYGAILYNRIGNIGFPAGLAVTEEGFVRPDGESCDGVEALWGVKSPVDGDEQFYENEDGDFTIYKAENIGTHTVPAGTFQNCFRIRNENYMLFGEDTLSTTEMELILAPDVGLIEYKLGSPALHYHLTSYGVNASTPLPECSTNNTEDVEIGLQNIRLAPNPVSSILNVDEIPNTKLLHYEILDIFGNVVSPLHGTVQNGHSSIQLDLSHLPAGCYFLSLYDGKQYHSRKIIKQ
jgi:hypothetical protein